MRNGKVKGLIFLSVALLIGFILAVRMSRFLEIEIREKQLPAKDQVEIVRSRSLVPFTSGIAGISLPKDTGPSARLYRLAAAELAKSLKLRTGSEPAIVWGWEMAPPGWIIAIGTQNNRVPVPPEGDLHWSSLEAFSLRSYTQDGRHILAISGSTHLAEIYGMYWLADQLKEGISEQDLRTVDRVVTPSLRYRFVDIGAVGIKPDARAWGCDYLHHSRAFQDVILHDEPYVDEQCFDRVFADFKEYLHRVISYGYNGIVFDGFLEFINFDRIDDGRQVYDSESEFRRRHVMLRKKFGELFDYAHRLGMKVILGTDMVALTPPLERYLQRRFGGIDTSSKQFWEVYASGLEELFSVFPRIDGIMIRTGEAGGVYNLAGWDYSSALLVRTCR